MTPGERAAPAVTTPGQAGPEQGPITRRAAAWLAVVAGLSLAAAGILAAFGDALSDPASYRPDGYSRSAVGHLAFLRLLEDMGRTVNLSRYRTAEKAEGGIVALLEPQLGEAESAEAGMASDVREAAPRLFLVLPKRGAAPDLGHRGWVSGAELLPEKDAQRVLDALGIEGTVIRPQASIASGAQAGALPPATVDAPQLIRSTALTPLLGSAEGMLAGELEESGHHLVVLADPDVLATHGLGRGQNADLAVALLDRLGGVATPLVVDETLHGHLLTPSITAQLLEFPLVLATLQALALIALLAWAALVRFGRPRKPTLPLDAGKALLLENTADLLRAGGHVQEAAAAYLRAAREAVLARLPPPGAAEEPSAWLARLETARGRAGTLRRLEDRLRNSSQKRRRADVEAIRVAQQIHRWREELTDGASGNPRPRRGAQG